MKKLLSVATQNSIPLDGGNLIASQANYPVIVVEGLDAAGVSCVSVCVCVCMHMCASVSYYEGGTCLKNCFYNSWNTSKGGYI